MSFGENLQFMRKIHKAMTQEELAERMGVSRQTISKWEMDASFPEMDKAINLTHLFNCTLDELFKDDINYEDTAYSSVRIEKKEEFRYVRYAVVSTEPEDDALAHIKKFAADVQLKEPNIIGWDFPFTSQEQVNVFHMHGYCAACILPKDSPLQGDWILTQPAASYVAITIEKPSTNPFVLIPNAYKILFKYIEVNGLKYRGSNDIISCYEKEYKADGVDYMDVCITIQ